MENEVIINKKTISMLAISEYFKENNLKVPFADSMPKDDNFASFKRQFNPS